MWFILIVSPESLLHAIFSYVQLFFNIIEAEFTLLGKLDALESMQIIYLTTLSQYLMAHLNFKVNLTMAVQRHCFSIEGYILVSNYTFDG